MLKLRSLTTALLLSVISLSAFAASPNITGTVTADGKPMAGVPVSDGEKIVLTDKKGRYAIDSRKKDGTVFVITPSGYYAPSTDNFQPAFWALLDKDVRKKEKHDFTLEAQNQDNFSILFTTDLANIINEAALLAARRNLETIPHAILEEARDKVFWGSERKSAGFTRKEYETTAWHESGHALLQLLLPNADPLHKVTIIPRGRALGVTMTLPEKDVLNRTKGYFLDELAVLAGGRIAEEMHTKDISTGAMSDISYCTQIARAMVCRYGMSERFGFQSFVVALGVADVGAAFNMVFVHQSADGLALAGSRVSEAQVPGDVGGQAQLFHAQLRIALLAVADDKKPVLFCQRFHGLCHPGVAHLTAA